MHIFSKPPFLKRLAQRLIQDPEVPVETICDRLGISSATLYRYVGPDGTRRK
jgi:predicted DNA-binding transcriptional regulator AlpA